jgi:hypothetical protein
VLRVTLTTKLWVDPFVCGKVAAVKTGHPRYADLRRDLPYVTEIKIAQVKTDG